VEIVWKGVYQDHEFRIHDVDNQIFIYFIDHFKEDNIEEFNKIKQEIKLYYLKYIKNE
jgi:hypothetical protein